MLLVFIEGEDSVISSKMKKEEITLEYLQKYKTVPYDPRFPNTNQTKWVIMKIMII